MRIIGFSIIVPALVAIIRVNKINRRYYPFILCICIGFLNECISYTLMDFFHLSNAINTNIYCLVESLLYVFLFKNFGLFKNQRFYVILISFLCAAWIFENLVISSLTNFDSYFTIVYSLAIVLMSITMVNRLIIRQINLFVNADFLICSALIIYFTLFAITQLFWLYGLNSSASFRLNIYRIMAYINLSVNLIFALAIIWMPRKHEFTPQQ